MTNNAHLESPSLPPPAPPLPPLSQHRPAAREKASIALKVRSAPPGWAFVGRVTEPKWDHVTPLAGTYFFYGTLQDPCLLQGILDLPSRPLLRPAHINGYKLRLWGHYPALVDEAGSSLQGLAFDVPDEASAEKLATYETNSYRLAPCLIHLDDSDPSVEPIHGFVFKYDGNPIDLSDGTFDLNAWRDKFGQKPKK